MWIQELWVVNFLPRAEILAVEMKTVTQYTALIQLTAQMKQKCIPDLRGKKRPTGTLLSITYWVVRRASAPPSCATPGVRQKPLECMKGSDNLRNCIFFLLTYKLYCVEIVVKIFKIHPMCLIWNFYRRSTCSTEGSLSLLPSCSASVLAAVIAGTTCSTSNATHLEGKSFSLLFFL